MEVEPESGDIIVSALRQPLFLGDIYDDSTNTFTKQGVLNMWFDLFPHKKKCVKLNQWNKTYFLHQPQACKWLHLGVDIHQHNTLRSRAINQSVLWFSDYINYSPPPGWAHVTIHFGYHGCRVSVVDVDLLPTIVNSEADPTAYVVNEILYGANCLLILEEPIGIGETEKSAKDRLFLLANCLAEGAEDSVELSDSTHCRFYSDLPSLEPLTGTLIQCFSEIEEILFQMQDSDLHIPLTAKLTPLSIEVSCPPSPCLDQAFYISTMIRQIISATTNDLFRLLADPFVQLINRMLPYLMHFHNCLNLLSIANDTTDAINCWEEKEERVIYLWQTYIANEQLTEWLSQRRRGLAIVKSLLRQIDLPFLAKQELPDLVAGQIRKVFMLKTVKQKDPFLEQFHLDFAQPEESPEWSFLEIVFSTEDHVDHVRSKLMEFAANEGPSVQRFISTSPHHEDAEIVTEHVEISDDDLTIRGTQLLKRGYPSIYLLQAEKCIGVDQFRWFELGSDSAKSSRHRTLFLIGVSGSGKSTLVDSFINYILNVQWTDPFRFRVDPESYGQQRSLVTAYTIHYVDGMSIPYSLTIIDTPGYTGDVESDIEATQLIVGFLTHPNSRQIFRTIDAICLVANSTQKIASSAQANVIEAVKFLFADCDYARKVHWYCTFASNPKKSPCVLNSIPSYVFPTDVHYEFENSILFAPKRVRSQNETEENYTLEQAYWDKAWSNHRSFFSQWNLDEPLRILSPTHSVSRKSICAGSS